MFEPSGGEEEQKLLDNIGSNWPDKWQLNVDVSVSSGAIDKPIATSIAQNGGRNDHTTGI
jgi:hypothetical protein